MKKIPTQFPVVAQDSINYLFSKYFSNSQISCILKLNGRMNQTILKQAVRLSLDVSPILGCYFMKNENNPVWERCEDFDEIDFFSIIEIEDVDTEVQTFISASFDFANDCQVKVRVLRAESDTICVKISHVCSDAGGLKQYLNLLISIYNQLARGQQYVVESTLSYSRGQDQFLSIPAVGNIINELAENGNNITMPTVKFPCKLGKNKNQAFVLKKLYQVDAIVRYAHSNGATVNDVLLTAFSRALSQIAEIQNKTISINWTVDLRRYLPNGKSEAICNLSAMQAIMITHDSQEPFEDTLSKLTLETKKLKSNNPGLKSAILLEMANKKMSFKDANLRFQQRRDQISKTQLCIPTFSNIGVITKDTMKFGLLEVGECDIVGPAAFSPDFCMVASTYNNILTVVVNFFQSTIPKEIVEQFIDIMCNELSTCVQYSK